MSHLASESGQIQVLKRALEGEASFLVCPSGVTMQMPPRVFELFKQLVEWMAAGRSVTLTAGDQLVTTQQAADILFRLTQCGSSTVPCPCSSPPA
jgi:hypothetical protein